MQAERTPLLSIAVVLTVALSSLAIHGAGGSGDTAVAKRNAETAAAQAVKDAQAAKDQLDRLMRELDELDNKIAQATKAFAMAENDADRAAAKARLEQLLKERDDLKARATSSRALAHRAERTKCVCIQRRCVANPLAKGCS